MVFVGATGAIALIGIASSMLPNWWTPTPQHEDNEVAERRRIYNALLMKDDRAAIAKRYNKTIEEIAAIEQEGRRLKWGLHNEASLAPAPKGPYVSATQLFVEFDRNEIAANQKYKGKYVVVSGTISSIATDITNTPYITLDTNDSMFSVQAMFGKADEGELAGLSPGNSLQVECLCAGKFGNVILRACRIR